jgi:hypothetical protein
LPAIAKLPSGSWRAQVRRKGRNVSDPCLPREGRRIVSKQHRGRENDPEGAHDARDDVFIAGDVRINVWNDRPADANARQPCGAQDGKYAAVKALSVGPQSKGITDEIPAAGVPLLSTD